MNSALQCLSATAPLTDYFLRGTWRDELNTDNPLGMGGRIPEAYATLIRNLWRSGIDRPASYAPRDFKLTIGQRNSTFQGYGQQDSHELLQSLLDGLHEDLNRIRRKVFVEDPDRAGESDDEFARISWDAYRRRNDSVIVDLFQALLKNRTVCQVCSHVSIKFDPYMYLQVPIPQPRDTAVEIVAVPHDAPSAPAASMRPRKIHVILPKASTIRDLKLRVAQLLAWSPLACADPAFSMVVELFQSKVHKVFDDDDETIDSFAPNDVICIVELGAPAPDFTAAWPRILDASGRVQDPAAHADSAAHAPVASLRPPFALTQLKVMLTLAPAGGNHFASSARLSSTSYSSSSYTIGKHFGNPSQAAAFKSMGDVLYRVIVRSLRRYALVPLFRRKGTLATNSLDSERAMNDNDDDDDDDDDDIVENSRHRPRPRRNSTDSSASGSAMPAANGDVYSASVQPMSLDMDPAGLDPAAASTQDSMLTAEDHQLDANGDMADASSQAAPGPHVNRKSSAAEPAERSSQSAPPAPPSWGPADLADNDFQNEAEWEPIPNLFRIFLSRPERSGYTPSYRQYSNYHKDLLYPLGAEEAEAGRLSKTAAQDGTASGIDANATDDAKTEDATVGALNSKTSPSTSRPPYAADGAVTPMADDAADENSKSPSSDLASRVHSKASISSPKMSAATAAAIAAARRKSAQAVKVNEPLYDEFTFSSDFEIVLDWDPAVASHVFGKQAIKTEAYYSSYSSYSSYGSSASTTTFDPEVDHVSRQHMLDLKERAKSTSISLKDCLAEFSREEILQGMDTMYCSKCKEHRPIRKKLDVYNAPKILVVHLKRFANGGRSGMSRSKIDVHVDAPTTGLDLSDVLVQPRPPTANPDDDLYDLYAVSNHFGGLGGGHYTAYAKNPVNGVWYNCDDSRVSPLSSDQIVTEAAYLLFYVHRSLPRTDLAQVVQEANERARAEEAEHRRRMEAQRQEQQQKFEREQQQRRDLEQQRRQRLADQNGAAAAPTWSPSSSPIIGPHLPPPSPPPMPPAYMSRSRDSSSTATISFSDDADEDKGRMSGLVDGDGDGDGLATVPSVAHYPVNYSNVPINSDLPSASMPDASYSPSPEFDTMDTDANDDIPTPIDFGSDPPPYTDPKRRSPSPSW
ncbi:hypothetical protein BC831DRAFT_446592 [Entophlyctis helioformis]|nr:hypothetical protein BC831DRAFT_446592 [Entophlyctis helioformis]